LQYLVVASFFPSSNGVKAMAACTIVNRQYHQKGLPNPGKPFFYALNQELNE
jgi:hypothetical protein